MNQPYHNRVSSLFKGKKRDFLNNLMGIKRNDLKTKKRGYFLVPYKIKPDKFANS